MLKRKLYVMVLVPLLSSLLAFSNCGRKSDDVIKIGCLISSTGSGALWGQNSRKGIELAEEQINAAGGIGGKKIQVLFEDSQTDPKTAVSAFRKLADVDGVKTCIADVISSDVLAVAPIANEKKIPLISPGASSPEITNAGDFIFRNWPSDALQGDEAAKWAFGKLGWRKPAVFYINNEYGKGLRQVFGQRFNSLGGRVAIAEPFEQGSTDFKTSLLKLKSAGVDGVYLVGYPKEVPIILKQARELNFNPKFLGTETFEDPAVLQQAGNAAEGVLYLLPKAPNPDSGKAKQFRDAYKAKYREDPGVPADVAYDALYILKWAMEQSGNDGAAVKDKLYALKEWDGASGTTTLDLNGDAIKPFDVKTIKDGKFVVYSEK